MKKVTRAFVATGAVLALSWLPAVLPAAPSGHGSACSWGGHALSLVGVSPAKAYWGVARRTARRTSRRTTARQNYLYHLPGAYTTSVVGGTTYYVVGTTYYQPVMVEGSVAYMPVTVTP